MFSIDYPKYDFKRMVSQEKNYIFDPIRKQWVKLTPEEWVRQNLMQYLIQTKSYPASNFAVEKSTFLDGMSKRCDVVIYKNGLPWMIVECKAQDITLDTNNFLQLLNYQRAIPVPYFCLTNGDENFMLKKEEKHLTEMDHFPDY